MRMRLCCGCSVGGAAWQRWPVDDPLAEGAATDWLSSLGPPPDGAGSSATASCDACERLLASASVESDELRVVPPACARAHAGLPIPVDRRP